MGLDEYLDYRSSLEAYPWMDNLTLDDDFGLNLYVIPTTYYIIVILGDWDLVKRRGKRIS